MVTSRAAIDSFLSLRRIAVVGVSRNEKDFSRMLWRELRKRGKRSLAVVTRNPGLFEKNPDVEKIIRQMDAPLNRWGQTDCMNRVEQDVAKKDPRTVSVIDLGRFVCPTFGDCRQTIDGAPMRPDGIHYRGRSAVAISSWLLPQLRQPATGGQWLPLASVSHIATVAKTRAPR